jgi:hypothetical protein
VLARTTKAAFNAIVVGAASSRFAEQWDGGGRSPQLVDVEQLRDAGLASRPHPSSFGLLQAAVAGDVGPSSLPCGHHTAGMTADRPDTPGRSDVS